MFSRRFVSLSIKERFNEAVNVDVKSTFSFSFRTLNRLKGSSVIQKNFPVFLGLHFPPYDKVHFS